jgi:hypothetical protein
MKCAPIVMRDGRNGKPMISSSAVTNFFDKNSGFFAQNEHFLCEEFLKHPENRREYMKNPQNK